MSKLADGTHLYPVTDRKKYGERPGFKITELTLGVGQTIPWHRHSSVIDTFYVIEGGLRIAMTEPKEQRSLGPAQIFQVSAGRAHEVTNDGKRSEERRVGKECVSTSRSRGSLYH